VCGYNVIAENNPKSIIKHEIIDKLEASRNNAKVHIVTQNVYMRNCSTLFNSWLLTLAFSSVRVVHRGLFKAFLLTTLFAI